jgi:hypothetical protein
MDRDVRPPQGAKDVMLTDSTMNRLEAARQQSPNPQDPNAIRRALSLYTELFESRSKEP